MALSVFCQPGFFPGGEGKNGVMSSSNMRKISKNQEQEFISHYDTLSDALFRHCFFRVSNREVALDMVQEGFTKTWQHIARGGKIENMKAFLYKVMNNLVIDYYRKRKSASLDALLEDGFDPPSLGHENIILNAEYSEVIKVLENIPESDRDVIVSRYIDGLSVKEIAKTQNESENAVSVRLHRALEKARKILNP